MKAVGNASNSHAYMTRFGITHKITLLSALLVSITAGTIAWVFYHNTTNLLVNNVLNDITTHVERNAQSLALHIESLREDVQFVTTMRVASEISETINHNRTNSAARTHLAEQFQLLLKYKPAYLQARLILSNGRELVRVNRDGNVIRSATEADLQDKSHSGYFIAAMHSANDVYLSQIELNREHNEISIPHQPVIRALAKLRNPKTGEVVGLVVVNMDIGQFFAQLNQLYIEQDYKLYITNESGYYLQHPDPNKTFAFEYARQYRAQEDFPLLSKFFVPGNTLHSLKLLPSQTDNHIAVVYTKVQIDQHDPSRFIAIGLNRPYQEIIDSERVVLEPAVIWALVLIALGTLFAYLFARILLTQLTQVIHNIRNFSHNREHKHLPLNRRDEIGILARAFAELAQAVEDSESSLRNLNLNLEQRIIERTRELEHELNQHRETELRLQDSQQMLGAVLDTIPVRLFWKDRQGRYLGCNNLFLQDAHLEHQTQIIGKTDHDMVWHEIADQYIADDRSVMESGNARLNVEVPQTRSDGQVIWLETSRVPLRDHNNKVIGILGTYQDISERKKIERMKNEFISTVSHELRTPLTSIRGALGLIDGGAVGNVPEKMAPLFTIAHNNTERLLLLINDILDIQKIESGQMRFHLQPLELSPFLERTLRDSQTYARHFHVNFQLGELCPDTWLETDPDRLHQVLSNLLSNAAKFSPEHSVVTLTATKQSGVVRISVIDSGPGVPDDFRDQIFKRFSQSDATDTRRAGGTGLGLNISKTITERLGGRIDFTSTVGQGSTFFVELPEKTMARPSGAGKTVNKADDSHHILIIEDDPDVAALLVLLLEDAGQHAETAYTAKQALELVQQQPLRFDAITLDLMLPDMDGFKLLRAIRKLPGLGSLPIIVISAVADATKQKINGGAIEVLEWLNKPIDKAHLLGIIEALPKKQHLPRILHVEDETDAHIVVGKILSGLASLELAKDLATAHTLLQQNTYDLVLLDLQLPDGSGLQLIKHLHALSPPPQIVIFSAHEVSTDVAKAVNSVLLKSQTSNETLLKTIRRILASS